MCGRIADLDTLRIVLKRAWKYILPARLESLIHSKPCRVQAVIAVLNKQISLHFLFALQISCMLLVNYK